jgi:hypothetical protein
MTRPPAILGELGSGGAAGPGADWTVGRDGDAVAVAGAAATGGGTSNWALAGAV